MRKRSTYKPRPVRLDTMAWVKAGIKRLTELPDTNAVVRIGNHSALASLAKGQGGKRECDTVIDALNITSALCAMGKGSDWHDEIRAGIDALESMARRASTTGRFVFTGPELTAVNLAMDIHDAQLDASTVIEMEKAMHYVNTIIRTGRAVRLPVGLAA